MHIFATFEHSLYLELAISELEQKGLKKEDIFAIAMEQGKSKRKILDNIHYSDGISIVDGATVLGSLLMVMGGIYGFLWEWGPIVWGLIGLSVGIVLGGILDYFIRQRKSKNKDESASKRKSKGIDTEVIVIIKCSKDQANLVEEVLNDHFALGSAKFDQEALN